MSDKYKATCPNSIYFMTCTVVGWVDVFSREAYRQIIIDSFNYCRQNKGLHINGYVIMTNHIHLIAWVEPPFEINTVMRDFKRHTASTILEAVKNGNESRKEWLLHMFGYYGQKAKNRKDFQFWQDGFHPVELWTDKVILQKLNYMHDNPVRAGFVLEAKDWKYSSAIDYTEGKGLFNIDMWWPTAFITID